jgi:DNA modification methylase
VITHADVRGTISGIVKRIVVDSNELCIFSRSDSEGNLLALHPTPKPVALIVDTIKDCTARGDLVLDPFLGSGTAIVAAERSGRRCYGLELDPLYVDTIIRRWQRQAKLEAVHVESGETFNSRKTQDADKL